MKKRAVRWRATCELAEKYLRAWKGGYEEWESILNEAKSLGRTWYGSGLTDAIMTRAWLESTTRISLDHGAVVGELLSEAVSPTLDTSWLEHITAGCSVLQGVYLSSVSDAERRSRAIRCAQGRAWPLVDGVITPNP